MPFLIEYMKCIPGYDPERDAAGFHFDAFLAERAIQFIETHCCHVKGEWAGKPLILEPWEAAVVGNLFGWVNDDNGLRRYRHVFVYVPRKNGKTILAAAISTTGFFIDREPGCEIYTCGYERDQASLSWNMAKQMINRNPDLKERCKIYTALKAIEKPDGSIFKPLSHDSESKHGFSTHMAVFDELHTYRNNELVDTITTSTGARRQPTMIYVTTADFERAGSPCNERHDYACAVRDGAIEDAEFLPVIYEADKDDPIDSVETWKKANPNFGISISERFLASEARKAANQPSYLNTFKRLYLNIRTDSSVQWLRMEDWKKCVHEEIDEEALIGQRCIAALDLAATTDLCALVYLFPESENAVICRFWVPRISAHKRKEKNRVKYVEWAEQGYIELTEGNVVDYEAIRNRINLDREKFQIEEIAIDRWNSTQVQTWLTDDGLDVVPYGQGFASMSAPTKQLEKLVLEAKLNHMNNPVLTWCINNVKVDEDAAGNLKPSKGKSTEKIDGAVALIMAIGRSMVQSTPVQSVYETRGLLTI